MSWPGGYGATSARFSAIVVPVTVRQSPCSKPASSKRLHQRLDAADSNELGHHVTATRPQVGQHRRPGADSREIIEREVDLASWAIASRCSTALVDPPSAITVVMAFSKASLLRMSDGLIPRLTSATTPSPARLQSSFFAAETASCAELFARLMPSASIADAIVFAVYMPPHEPGPGIAVDSTSFSSASSILPAAWLPTASKTEMMSRCLRSRLDRAAVDEDRRPIQPGHRHHAAGHVLVAAADRDEPVESFRRHDGFDRIGDDLAGHEGVAHARCAHRDAVGHRNRIEKHALAARGVSAGGRLPSPGHRCACCTG